MATLTSSGGLFGKPLIDTKHDTLIESSTTKDVVIKIDDVSNLHYLKVTDGSNTVRATIRSDGLATFSALNATLAYIPSFAAGSVAAASPQVNTALDNIFSGIYMSFNEISTQTPNGVATNFPTTGSKKFQSGKIMVFLGGLKQQPGIDYSENVSKQSVDFFIPPPTGLLVEFSYIIG
jgi:hypothetical protein